MTKIKESYSAEFKEEAVRLALQSNEAKSLIAEELGIRRSTLYSWIKQSMQERVGVTKSSRMHSSKYQELEQENRRLRAQLKRTQQERDILKKAAAYFASQEL